MLDTCEMYKCVFSPTSANVLQSGHLLEIDVDRLGDSAYYFTYIIKGFSVEVSKPAGDSP